MGHTPPPPPYVRNTLPHVVRCIRSEVTGWGTRPPRPPYVRDTFPHVVRRIRSEVSGWGTRPPPPPHVRDTLPHVVPSSQSWPPSQGLDRRGQCLPSNLPAVWCQIPPPKRGRSLHPYIARSKSSILDGPHARIRRHAVPALTFSVFDCTAVCPPGCSCRAYEMLSLSAPATRSRLCIYSRGVPQGTDVRRSPRFLMCT